MSGLRVLQLYRPRLPSTRAQSIQVLGTAWGLARRGCQVTLLADAPRDNMPVQELPTIERVLDWYQLPPVEGLNLKLAPTSIPWAQSFWFRKHVTFWLWESMRHHSERSVILARAKRYVDEYFTLPFGPPVVLEAHEVDSVLAREREEDPLPMEKLEQRVLSHAGGLVSNCAGTMALLEQTHPELLPPNRAVVRNATNARRVRNHLPQAEKVIGYAGSLRAFKGIHTMVKAAAWLPEGYVLEILGGSAEEQAALGPISDKVRIIGDLPYAQIPDYISRWHAGVIALDDNVFGRWLCNPLKLWDYLAVGLPVVLPELPTMREMLGRRHGFWFQPGDPESMARAMQAAVDTPPSRIRRRHLRSWEDRADELIPVLEEALR